MRIVAVTTVSGPYVVARYRSFAEWHPQHELILLELGRVAAEYAWCPSREVVPYRRVVLSEAPIQHMDARSRLGMIEDALCGLRPEVLVVCGYGVTGMGAALRWARRQRPTIPVVMLSESTASDDTRVAWREWIKARAVRQCGGALVGGRLHRHYMGMLGMSDDCIFEGYDVVDNRFFEKRVQLVRNGACADHSAVRPFFLASNRFIPKKNIERLIAAFGHYRRSAGTDAWDLTLLGDGELREAIENQIADLALDGAVHLPGFKQYDELADYYARAGCFVHASTTEQWGLVVNEAMASGLPVIVSERCGCAPDLVEEGRNGFTFDPFDVGRLANLMRNVASDDCDRAAMGRASRDIIERWTPQAFARGLGQAVEAALATPVSRLGRVDRTLLWVLAHR